MAEGRDAPSIVGPPPVFFLACLLTGGLLHRLLPIGLGLGSRPLRLAVAGPLSIASALLALLGFVELRRHQTPVDPAKTSVALVTGGVFAWSRNPMYVSLALLLASIAAALNSLWLALLVPLLIVVLDRGVMRPEETYLSQKFGERYLEYTKRVRRWL